MKITTSSLVLATLAVGQAAAATMGHAHSAYHNHAHRHAEIMKAEAENAAKFEERDGPSILASLGIIANGVNAAAPNGGAWIGTQGPYTNTFTNNAASPIIVVCWGPAGSWVNAVTPTITYGLNPGQSFTASFANGAIGACSAVYPDTTVVNGQISNTWVEFTFGQYGVVDVSREVNMNGHSVSVVGPTCTTNMSTCVFVCPTGNSCMTGYQLLNCANGSQQGANYGTYEGSPSGGCGGMGASAALKTTFS